MDFKEIKELIRVFDKSELNKLKVKEGEFEVAMQKGFEGNTVVTTSTPVAAPIAAPVSAPIAAPVSADVDAVAPVSGETLNSPMIGTYYSAPSPEASAFVKKGDTVKQGQTLCILEAMKIMNEFEAEYDCKIVDVLVNDGQPVEYDMPLFVVEKL